MNNMLSRLNKNMIEREKKSKENVKSSEDNLLLYKLLKENKGTIEVKFHRADSQGTHYSIDDNGVNLKLLATDMKLSGYQKMSGAMLGANIVVSVKAIDEENNTVYFYMNRTKTRHSDSINAEIKNDLEHGEKVRLNGRIIQIFHGGNAWVKLLDQCVGNIDVRDWAKTYTRSLEDVCAVNEVYEFDVVGVYKIAEDGSPIWKLSRKEITPDPWLSLPAQFKEGNVMLVKAVEKREDKSFYWGSSPLTPGIQIMCNYPSNMQVTIGAYYKCKIVKINYKDRIFRVSPFAICPIHSDLAIDLKELAKDVSKEN